MSTPKCPSCQGSDVGVLDSQRAVCRSCSKMKRGVFQFCRACQREWPQNASNYACTLSNCALRAALLSDTKISDPHSSVRGCPFFRACPGCKALLTHSGIGCPNITCPHCNTWFCFRCLHVGHFGMRIIGDRGLLTRPLFLFHEHAITGCRVVDNKLSLVILGNK